MKIKGLLLILLGLAFSGCVSAHYVTPTGETLNYTRLGKQELYDFKLTKGADGSAGLSFEKQKGDAGILAESVNNISQLMLRMTEAYAGVPVPPIQPQPMPTPQPTLQPTPTPGN